MGYSYASLDWLSSLGAKRGSKVLDLGSQDLFMSDPREPPHIDRFLARHGGKSIGQPALPCTIPMHEIWTRIGVDYQCVDIDERPGTVRVDLQSLDFPRKLKSRYDLVMNAGTTEHLANPAYGFSFMHFACRDGGILANDVPFSGYGNHALMNPTAKFWHLMAMLNHYETLTAQVRESPETPGDGTYYNEAFNYISDLGTATNLSWMISIAFRKKGLAAFVPPMDYAPGPSAGSTLALIKASLLPFGRTWTRREIESALDNVAVALWGRPNVSPSAGRLMRVRKALGI